MEWGDYIADAVHDAKRLEELRALPLERKIQISQARIIEWYNHYHGNVVVSFSGGKDSTVLLHLVRSIFPNVKAVFSNTGLEYPEIQKHVMSIDNVDIVRPAMRFDEVISTYGYPLIGKEVAEAIFYARRIRSQSGHVEREREREPYSTEKAERAGRNARNHAPENSTPRRAVTKRLQIGGGADRPSEYDRDSQCQAAEESSYPDEHCKEQTNHSDRADERIRNGAGVAVKPLTIGGGWSSPQVYWRRIEMQGKRTGLSRAEELQRRIAAETTSRTDGRQPPRANCNQIQFGGGTAQIQTGMHTKRKSDGDTNSEDSEPG